MYWLVLLTREQKSANKLESNANGNQGKSGGNQENESNSDKSGHGCSDGLRFLFMVK